MHITKMASFNAINNGILHKWHLKLVPYKNGTLCAVRKKWPKVICPGQLKWVIFKRELLNLLYDSGSWSWDFKVKFFQLQSDMRFTLLCLFVGVGSIRRVLVVFQKTNRVVVRCYDLCWVSFLQGGIFDKRSAFFLTVCQWVP